MLLANFNGKEHLQHRAVSLRQHGFLVISVHTVSADADARRLSTVANFTSSLAL